eukprot:2473525-Amphidinium_carterae.1
MRSPAGAEVAGQRRASTSPTAISGHTGNILREAAFMRYITELEAGKAFSWGNDFALSQDVTDRA